MIPHTQYPSRASFIPYRVQQAFRDKYIRLICKYLPSNKKYLLEFLVVNGELVVRDYGTKLDVMIRDKQGELNKQGELCYISGCEFLYNIEAKNELTSLQKEIDSAYERALQEIQRVQKTRTRTT